MKYFSTRDKFLKHYQTNNYNLKTEKNIVVSFGIQNLKALLVFSLVTFISLISFSIYDFYIEERKAVFLLLIVAIFNCFTLVLVYFKYTRATYFYFFALNSFVVFYYDSFIGTKGGTYMFYFPIIMGIANCFNPLKKVDKLLITILLTLVISLISINLLTDYSLFFIDYLTEKHKSFIFLSNFFFSMVIMGIFISIYNSSNNHRLLLFQNVVHEENKLRILENEKNLDRRTLLDELQFKLKNNLSLIYDYLEMKMLTAEKENQEQVVYESLHAIQTISYAYQIQQFNRSKISVNAKAYLKEIVLYWKQLFREAYRTIDFRIDSPNLTVNLNQIIPIGLIFHELLIIQQHHNNVQGGIFECQIATQLNDLLLKMKFSEPSVPSVHSNHFLWVMDLVDQLEADFIAIDEYNFVIAIPLK